MKQRELNIYQGLIADFLNIPGGIFKYTDNPDDPGVFLYQFSDHPTITLPIKDHCIFHTMEELEYYKSTAWIITAIDKILKLPTPKKGEEGYFILKKIDKLVRKGGLDNEVFKIFKCVVDYIMWYNKYKNHG